MTPLFFGIGEKRYVLICVDGFSSFLGKDSLETNLAPLMNLENFVEAL